MVRAMVAATIKWTYADCWSVCLVFSELVDFKTRRVAAFRKNLVELAELELKHAKVRWSGILGYAGLGTLVCGTSVTYYQLAPVWVLKDKRHRWVGSLLLRLAGRNDTKEENLLRHVSSSPWTSQHCSNARPYWDMYLVHPELTTL